MIDAAALITYVERVHQRTYEAAERLAAELIEWSPRAEEFTAAELVMHIASCRLMNAGTIAGRGTHYAGHEPPPKATVRVLERYLEQTSIDVLRMLRETDLSALIPRLDGSRSPAWSIALAGLIEHEVHHRSQLCDYLSAAGIEPPPLYGLHAEDLPR